MQKIEFIGDIATVQSYLGKWGNRVNFGNNVVEITRKSMRESKDKWCDEGGRKNWILVMGLPKFLLSKLLPKWVWSARSASAWWSAQRETNCDNQVSEILRRNFKMKKISATLCKSCCTKMYFVNYYFSILSYLISKP